MKRTKKLQITTVLIAFVIVVTCVFSCFATKAFAWSIDDWRPSVAIKADIDNWNKRIDEIKKSEVFFKNLINDFETNGNTFSEDIEILEARYNYLHEYLNDERSNIEEMVKLSYAAYIAKTILDDVVGSDIATNTIFKWGFVNFILSIEDDSILHFFDEYNQAKDELDQALSDEKKAEEIYKNAKTDLAKCEEEITNLTQTITYWQNNLEEIYAIEDEYGAAGTSLINGSRDFCYPCANINISSYFGDIDEREFSHKGIDFQMDVGTPVYVSADGKVIETGETENSGIYIIVEHDNGFVTAYRHLSHIFVPCGMKVHKGDNIALSGNTGDSTGPHLHFEIVRNGVAVDPLEYLEP